MDKIGTALILGLTLNYPFCIFLCMGLASVDKATAYRFILGRAVALLLISLLLVFLGDRLQISPRIMTITFGLATIVCGLILLRGGHPGHRVGGLSFSMGFFRGFTPCFKVVAIIPLLLSVRLLEALGIISAYIIASSVYPLIGAFSAGYLKRFQKHRKVFRYVGSGIVITIGIIYLLKPLFHINLAG